MANAPSIIARKAASAEIRTTPRSVPVQANGLAEIQTRLLLALMVTGSPVAGFLPRPFRPFPHFECFKPTHADVAPFFEMFPD